MKVLVEQRRKGFVVRKARDGETSTRTRLVVEAPSAECVRGILRLGEIKKYPLRSVVLHTFPVVA